MRDSLELSTTKSSAKLQKSLVGTCSSVKGVCRRRRNSQPAGNDRHFIRHVYGRLRKSSRLGMSVLHVDLQSTARSLPGWGLDGSNGSCSGCNWIRRAPNLLFGGEPGAWGGEAWLNMRDAIRCCGTGLREGAGTGRNDHVLSRIRG